MSHYRLFIGYPCVGKSTIINCLEQRILFKSGSTYKDDLKDHLQKIDHKGTTYVEICFKNGTEWITEVAQRINNVIKQRIKYQIFFVVETKNQKIREKDLNAIQLVLQNTENISYYLIINKLPIPVYEKIRKDDKLGDKLIFPDGKKMKPASAFLLQHEKFLDDAEDKFMKLKGLENFAANIHYYIYEVPAKEARESGNNASFPNGNS